MNMFDILGLPGVALERGECINNGAYSGHDDQAYVSSAYIDALIQVVADAVEEHVRREVTERERDPR